MELSTGGLLECGIMKETLNILNMKKNEIILRVLKDKYESVEDKEQAYILGSKFLVANTPYGFTGNRGLRNAQQYAQDGIIERKIGTDGYVYFRWSPELWEKHLMK